MNKNLPNKHKSEAWDYTTKGFAHICKDGVDSICSTIKELEDNGYIIRERIHNNKGLLTTVEYIILEQPKPLLPEQEKFKQENPVLDKPKYSPSAKRQKNEDCLFVRQSPNHTAN